MIATDTGREKRTKSDRWTPAWAEWPGLLLRVGLGIGAVFIAGYAAAFALFFGAVVTTGCFMSCSDPNPLIGVPLLALSAGLFTVGLAALWWAFVDRYWRVALKTLAILGSILALGLVIAVTGYS